MKESLDEKHLPPKQPVEKSAEELADDEEALRGLNMLGEEQEKSEEQRADEEMALRGLNMPEEPEKQAEHGNRQ